MAFWGYRAPPPAVAGGRLWRYYPPGKEIRIEYWGWENLGPVTFQYTNFRGLAEDAFPANFVELPFQSRLLLATIRDAPAILQCTFDGITDQPERRFEIGFARVEAVRGFKIRNAEPGRICRYQIMPMR